MSSSYLEQLRTTLKSLEEYEIPASLKPHFVDVVEEEKIQSNDDDNGGINYSSSSSNSRDALLDRYEKTRNEYLNNRLQEKFFWHLQTFHHLHDANDEQDDKEPTNNNDENSSNISNHNRHFQLPTLPTKEEQEQLQQQLQQVQLQVLHTAKNVHTELVQYESKYQQFQDKKSVLQSMIQDLESKNKADDDSHKGNHHDQDEILMDDDDDGEKERKLEQQQEERLQLLRQRKTELQAKLKQLKDETQQIENDNLRKKQQYQHLIKGHPELQMIQSSQLASSQEDMEHDSNNNVEQLQEKLMELKEIKLFYDTLRESMEELGGIQIISVQNASSSPPDKTRQQKREQNNEVIVLKVKVLQEHEIQIGLGLAEESSSSVNRYKSKETRNKTSDGMDVDNDTDTIEDQDEDADNNNSSYNLRVVNAKYITDTITTNYSHAITTTSKNKEVLLQLLPLDDLVQICQHFPSNGQDIRFLLREAMVRIQIIQARVIEFASIHKKYIMKEGPLYYNTSNPASTATTVGNNDDNTSHGVGQNKIKIRLGGEEEEKNNGETKASIHNIKHLGGEQEIICSFNEGIALILYLTPDCPMLPGSVSIHEIITFGWDQQNVQHLNNIQKQINKERYQYHKPMQILNTFRERLDHLIQIQDDETFVLPKTPPALPVLGGSSSSNSNNNSNTNQFFWNDDKENYNDENGHNNSKVDKSNSSNGNNNSNKRMKL